jgi:hypothetical protein
VWKTAVSVILSAPLLVSTALFAQTAEQLEFFEKKVRPILSANCAACHNAKTTTAGLDLSTTEGIRYAVQYGGEAGKLVSLEKPADSLLLQAIEYTGRLKMPPGGKLNEDQLDDLRAWVHAGTPVPAAAESAKVRPAGAPASVGGNHPLSPSAGPRKKREFTEAEKNFWAFQKFTEPPLPSVKDTAWVKSPIDRFILAKLEAQKLKPGAAADKATLLRRATFDLTGLPPTEAELKDFLADTSTNAFEKAVDRLLASPRYGEQWGRHWLDVARYADSTGNDEDHRYPYAYHYRDYVIDSFNKDVPLDRFVREQIAGDLLPSDPPGAINRRGLIATGFLALGQKALAQQDKKKLLFDMYDEQIDTISKGMLGVTLSCARCHDHKFDPLFSRDYYALVAILAATRNFEDAAPHVSKLLFRPLASKEELDRYQKAKDTLTNAQNEADDFLYGQVEKYLESLVPRAADYMLAARRVYRDKADPAAVSTERNLSPQILEKWVSFLEPSVEARPYLKEWEDANDDTVAAVAQSFQKRIETGRPEAVSQQERIRRLRRRRQDMPPVLKEGPDKFFNEAYFRGPFVLSNKEREAILTPEARDRLSDLRKVSKDLEAKMPPEPEMSCSVEDGVENVPLITGKVLVRGDYNSPGEDAPKGFPLIVAGEQPPLSTKGSGRLELASWLTQRDHPLTSRVFVNRVWYWHFGEGLVRTPDNFGKMGETPTHPELLNYLSRRFVEGGWSVKALHRLILLSNTYQMSSLASDPARTADPENKLFSRFPRRRLSVEEIRDGMLSIDGTLDLTMGGTLQSGFGTDGENSSNRLSIRPEASKRRQIYLPLRRANLPILLNLFDFGDATTASSKRPATTVAPQALFMMNSDFVTERAQNIARQVLENATLDPAGRVRAIYLKVLSRQATAPEVSTALSYVDDFQKRGPAPADAWTSFGRILLASNEYIYLD